MIRQRSLLASIKYAVRGISDAVKSEPNLRIHFIITVLIIIAAFLFRFTPLEWVTLTLTIFFVIALEMINTAIEKIVNFISPEKSETARAIKDISAAVVLSAAVCSLIVGAFLFLPKIYMLLGI